MKALKALARDWLPPAVVRQIRLAQQGQRIRFEGDFSSWEAAKSRCTGYDAGDILSKVLAATLMVKRGEAAFERDSVLFHANEYSWPLLSGLLWSAARNEGRLNVLDFGGSLGSSYFQHRRFLDKLPEVRWNVVEQPHYVESGRTHIQDAVLRFYASIEQCLADNKPNVILLSSVLQYLQAPVDILAELPEVGASGLIIDRTPFSFLEKDKLVIQRVPAAITCVHEKTSLALAIGCVHPKCRRPRSFRQRH
jgi:putative methyltransferase (TIGR04325 family)